MSRIAQLKSQVGAMVADMRAMVTKAEGDQRDLSADELTEYTKLSDKVKALKAEIGREEDLLALERDTVARQDAQRNDRPQIGIAGSFLRTGKLRAFKSPIRVDGRELKAEEAAYRSGQWLAAAIWGDQKAQRWCAENGILIQAAASEGVNTKGGFLVPEEFSQAIIDLREEYGVFRRNARVLPMARDTMNIPRRTGGLTAYFVGENTEVTASDKAWDSVSLVAKKIAALSKYSTELAEDAVISIADDLANEMAYAFANKEDDCGFNGTGASTYGGIQGVTNKLSGTSGLTGAVDTVTSGADKFSELAAIDLTTLMANVPQYALRNSKFYCSQYAWSVVFERIMSATGGTAVNTISGTVNKSFLGYPVEITQVLSASSGSLDNAAMILFGDLSMAATLGDRRGFTLMISDHRFMELDQLAIRGTSRFDINVHDVGTSSAAGPLVALVGAA